MSRFADLPVLQRSVVVLKDVLDESLAEIAALLDLSVDAVKGHLARGRARLREINAQGPPPAEIARPSADGRALCRAIQRAGLGRPASLLADDVKLSQSTRTRYASAARKSACSSPSMPRAPRCRLAPAWLEGAGGDRGLREAARMPKPSYMMWLEWARRSNQVHPRLPVRPLCRRRRRAEARPGPDGDRLSRVDRR